MKNEIANTKKILLLPIFVLVLLMANTIFLSSRSQETGARIATTLIPTTTTLLETHPESYVVETIPPTTVGKKKTPETTRPPRASRSQARYGSGACGGELPPCSTMMCESGGNLSATNGKHRGKWQFAPGTWRNEKGGYRASDGKLYPDAGTAPEWVQDERAKQLWAGGRGTSHWEQCL
jgi:hypothetical protein